MIKKTISTLCLLALMAGASFGQVRGRIENLSDTITPLEDAYYFVIDPPGTGTGNKTGKMTATTLWTGFLLKWSTEQDVVLPDHILSTGQVDELCLSYEASGDTFEWKACTGIPILINGVTVTDVLGVDYQDSGDIAIALGMTR